MCVNTVFTMNVVLEKIEKFRRLLVSIYRDSNFMNSNEGKSLRDRALTMIEHYGKLSKAVSEYSMFRSEDSKKEIVKLSNTIKSTEESIKEEFDFKSGIDNIHIKEMAIIIM